MSDAPLWTVGFAQTGLDRIPVSRHLGAKNACSGPDRNALVLETGGGGMALTGGPDDMLVVIDVQNDFCPDGALAVGDGDAVVPIINQLMNQFQQTVATQDWHPKDHASFAANHKGAEPFSTIKLAYGDQTLWPVHCLQGTDGAEFHRDLDSRKFELVVRKGFRPDIDSYSAFFENDRKTSTGLAGYLKDRGIKRAFFAGLATDYCVAYSALDCMASGIEASVILDACRAIDLDGSLAKMIAEMRARGVKVVVGEALF
jgi:nicotinamidase/pyrazinamidase